jgi:hypothetical protein
LAGISAGEGTKRFDCLKLYGLKRAQSVPVTDASSRPVAAKQIDVKGQNTNEGNSSMRDKTHNRVGLCSFLDLHIT